MKLTAAIKITFDTTAIKVKLADITYNEDTKKVFYQLDFQYMRGYTAEVIKQIEFAVPYLATTDLNAYRCEINGNPVVIRKNKVQ